MHTRIRLAAACSSLLVSVPAASQLPGRGDDLRTRSHWGIGYAVNAPTQLLGFSTMALGPALGGWGVYADVKFTRDSPRDRDGFDAAMTVEQAEALGDLHMKSDGLWTTVNVALVRVLSDALAIYGGAGYSKETAFRRYHDETFERGFLGTYWVEDPASSGNRVNVLGGAWFRATRRICFQFGGEAAPAGITVGAAYLLPIGR